MISERIETKKTYNKKQIFLVCFFGFFMLINCEKEPPRLPEETQVGLGTFGCLVNGELVVQRYNDRWNFIYANYDSVKSQFVLITKTEYFNYDVRIFVTQPKLGICVIDSAIFYPSYSSIPNYYVARNIGQMNFTRVDDCFSGTFEFDADIYEKQTHRLISNQKIQVRKGVFDVKTYINETY